LLIVYAEAFERDRDPDDFSLEAIVAHERGHQILVRHPRIARMVAGKISEASEEILASIIGAMICPEEADRDALLGKAVFELLAHGEQPDVAVQRIRELREHLEPFL
jgi:hypothetical protein